MNLIRRRLLGGLGAALAAPAILPRHAFEALSRGLSYTPTLVPFPNALYVNLFGSEESVRTYGRMIKPVTGPRLPISFGSAHIDPGSGRYRVVNTAPISFGAADRSMTVYGVALSDQHGRVIRAAPLDGGDLRVSAGDRIVLDRLCITDGTGASA